MSRFISLVALVFVLLSCPVYAQYFETWSSIPQSSFTEGGKARVLVEFNTPQINELRASNFASENVIGDTKSNIEKFDIVLSTNIQNTSAQILKNLNNDVTVLHHYQYVPIILMEVDKFDLMQLSLDPNVTSIYADELHEIPVIPEDEFGVDDLDIPHLQNSTLDMLNVPAIWNQGYTGSNWYVAIIDSGIMEHAMFAGKNVIEACFANICPNGSNSMYGPGSAAHPRHSTGGHGTSVTAVAAGKNFGDLTGVAKDANIIAINVFALNGTRMNTWTSDYVRALEYVYSLRNQYNIGAANMSLGGDSYGSYCNFEPTRTAINNLLYSNIPTVISSGNNGLCGAIGSPGCQQTAISVGSTTKSDTMASTSNHHDTVLDIVAPGSSIRTASSSSTTATRLASGTSFAAPFVSGSLTLLRQKHPNLSVAELFQLISTEGPNIPSRCPGNVTKPRLFISVNGTPQPEPECEISISPSTISTNYQPSRHTITVSANRPNCNWNAEVDNIWMTISPTSGMGNGTIQLLINDNTLSTPRSGQITVGNNSIAVTQERYPASVCVVSIQPSSVNINSERQSGTFNVNLNIDTCAWNAYTSADWITRTPTSNHGNTQVTWTVTENTSTTPRTGVITIHNAEFTITQAGRQQTETTLKEALDNPDLDWVSGGHSGVTWVVDSENHRVGGSSARSNVINHSNNTWMETTVTGPGTITFLWKVSSERTFDRVHFQINSVSQTRISGDVDWHEQSFNVPAGTHTLRWIYEKDGSVSRGQDAAWVDNVRWTPGSTPDPCTYTINPTTLTNISAEGETKSITLTTSRQDCTWNTHSNVSWMSASPTSGTGSRTLTLTISANNSLSARGSSIRIGSQVLTVTQSGKTQQNVDIGRHLDNNNLTFRTTGNPHWSPDTTQFQLGGSSMKSGRIGHSSTTTLETIVTGPGTLRFLWKVSSEGMFDFGFVYLGSSLVMRETGEIPWRERYLIVPPGTHTIRWVYSKDASVSRGADAMWVDNVRWAPSN